MLRTERVRSRLGLNGCFPLPSVLESRLEPACATMMLGARARIDDVVDESDADASSSPG